MVLFYNFGYHNHQKVPVNCQIIKIIPKAAKPHFSKNYFLPFVFKNAYIVMKHKREILIGSPTLTLTDSFRELPFYIWG